jgi:hypothetical protein
MRKFHEHSPAQIYHSVDSIHFPVVCTEAVYTETRLSLKTGPFSEIILLNPQLGAQLLSPTLYYSGEVRRKQRFNDPANSGGGEDTIKAH